MEVTFVDCIFPSTLKDQCACRISRYVKLPATQRNISEDQNPQHKHCRNVKSCKNDMVYERNVLTLKRVVTG